VAKVTPSALITAIQGKWRGSCFQMWKGIITVRRNPIPRVRNKESRYKFKGTVSSLSSCHYQLTAAQKVGWSDYAALLPTTMTGFNAFMARNCVLALSGHPTLCIYFTAPVTYSPPIGPAPIGLCYYPITNKYCLFWSDPNCTSVFVQGRYAVQVGYSNQKSPSWRNFNTIVSTVRKMDFDASQFPSDTMIRFTALSINKNGETSLMAEAKPPPLPPPDLYVYEPNGSERYYVGSSHFIYWNSINIDNIKIDYSINNGADWLEITPSVTGSHGQYLWTIPDVSSSQCLVKISDVSNPSNFDTSNANFTILTAPTVSVTSPNGTEEWKIGTKHNITWNHTDCTNVRIRYSYDNGLNYTTLVSSTAAAAGSWEWTIPDHESSTCLVKILCVEDLTVYDVSDNTFSIVEPAIPGDCIAWWLFKTAGYDVGNSRFTDQTGNGHHAENYGGSVGASYTTMDGSSDYLSIPDFTELSDDSKHLSVFIWLDGYDDKGGLFEHYYLDSHSDAWSMFFSSYLLYLSVSNNVDETTKKEYKSNLTVMDNTPHSVGFTFNSGTLKVYIDGVEDTDIVKIKDDSFDTIYNSIKPFIIGRRGITAIQFKFLATKLYKAYLYNSTLSPAEMLTLHNEGT